MKLQSSMSEVFNWLQVPEICVFCQTQMKGGGPNKRVSDECAGEVEVEPRFQLKFHVEGFKVKGLK